MGRKHKWWSDKKSPVRPVTLDEWQKFMTNFMYECQVLMAVEDYLVSRDIGARALMPQNPDPLMPPARVEVSAHHGKKRSIVVVEDSLNTVTITRVNNDDELMLQGLQVSIQDPQCFQKIYEFAIAKRV